MLPLLPSSRLHCLILAALSLPLVAAAAVSITPLSPAQLWQRAEFRLDGVPDSANPFDPHEIAVDAVFTAPSGTTYRMPAFWYQDHTRALVAGKEVVTPRGSPEWRLRFTPVEPGRYRIAVLIAQKRGQAAESANLEFDATGAEPAGRHGWVRVASDRRTLETTDGTALRLIGENVCWPGDRGTYNYDLWFSAMGASGQNFARLWMAPWWAGLEHSPGTLNRYKLDAAWQLDRIFEQAEAKGLYLLFCFDHHGMYMSNDPAWGGSNNYWLRSNPYARENGGPCVSPNDFFKNPQAQEIYQKRLRYLVARYGYSPNLLAWQFFNEIDNAYVPRSDLLGADVVAWHRAMGRWLHENDPYRHLVTTSLTGGSDRPALWEAPEMDFSMYHSYADPAPGRKVATLSADFVNRYGKPVMIGEFGVSARDWARPMDPHLRGFRQALWAGALGGSVGTSMSWWWEDIHDDRAYSLFAALHAVLDRAGWSTGAWRPVDLAAPPPPLELAAPAADAVLFNAPLALNAFRRILLPSEAAIPHPLAAERSSEFLSGFLRGARTPDQQRPLRALGWFGPGAKLTFRVESVASEAELVARIDGAEKLREKLGKPEALPPGESRKLDRELTLAVPEGRHWIEIANVGADWASLDLVRLDGLRRTEYSAGWRHGPEAVGMRQDAKAVLYVYSPWMVYPAGQHRYDGPLMQGERVTLPDWPDGQYRAEWYSPRHGRRVAQTEGSARGGKLELPLPDFSDDLSGIVTRAE